MSTANDRWAGASTYEAFMGRWSRLLAPRFLSWLEVPPGIDWLDVGCGTGALSEAVCRFGSPASVLGCDPAEAFIEYARSHAAPGASFTVAGVGSLPARRGGYGSVTSMLALNFFPDPLAALREMHSLTSRDGRVSACVWDYAGRMEFLRRFWDAAAALDPLASELDEGKRFPICRRDPLVELFRGAGLKDVRCEPIEVSTEFSDFQDYWKPYLGGTGPAPSYVASLDPEQKDRLAGDLERTLPRGRDGKIVLTAGAWAVQGRARLSRP